MVLGGLGLALLVFFVFVHWHQTLDIKLGTEVFKTTYQYLIQFCVIAMLGGFVTYVYTRIAQEREQRASDAAKERDKEADQQRTRQELRQKFYDEYIQTINGAVKILFLLDARAIRKDLVYAQQYDEVMEKFLNVAVGLTSLQDRLNTDTTLFVSVRQHLLDNFGLITNYFYDLTNEYKNSMELFKGDPATLKREALKHLDEFLSLGFDKSGANDELPFRKNFKIPNDGIRSDLLKTLLQP